MKKIKNFISKISYAILPFLIFALVLLVTYFGNQILTTGAVEGSWHYGTTWPYTPVDDIIPLVPEFIYVYYLTFPVGFVTFFYLAYKNKKSLYDMFLTLIVSFAISGIIYFLFQSYFVKPDFVPDSFTDNLVVWTWNSTNPTNVFPSQHCFMAIATFIACLECKDMKLWYRIFGFAVSILIVLSTVFTKQHYAIDFLGSLVIMLPIYLLTKRSGMGDICKQKFQKFYEKFNKKR